MDYLDFELEIKQGKGRRYPIEVIRSPVGEAEGEMAFPYDQLALENQLQNLQIALLTRTAGTRRVAGKQEQLVQEFGSSLFNALFNGEVRSRFDSSRLEAKRQGKGLRLKLRCESPLMASLPWEFLFDLRSDDYLCLSRNTPLVRYLEMNRPSEALQVAPPIKILGMVASPTDVPGLDVERERERIDRAMKPLEDAGMVSLHWLKGQTWRDLQQVLWTESWHIFHFIGHGAFDDSRGEGMLVFAGEDGRRHDIGASDLGMLLGDQETLRLAVLNSCEGARSAQNDVFSSTAAVLVRKGVPAVLAMQYEISDYAAIELARSFYEAVSVGLPVDAALGAARQAVRLANTDTLEWGTPVLFMRSQDGALFELTADRPPGRRPNPDPIDTVDLQRFASPAPVGPAAPLRAQSVRNAIAPGSDLPGLDLSWGGLTQAVKQRLEQPLGNTSKSPADLGKKAATMLARSVTPAPPTTARHDRLGAAQRAPEPSATGFCRKCGTPRLKASKFCRRCGASQ